MSQTYSPVKVTPSEVVQGDRIHQRLANSSEPSITRTEIRALVQEEQAKSDQSNALENTAINRRIMWFTGLLTLLGGIQAWVIWRTLGLTKQSADAATKSATSAEQALVSVERPWLTFHQPDVNPKIGGNLGMGIGALSARGVYPTVANSGRSPAILRSMGAKLYFGAVPPPCREVWKQLLRARMSGILAPEEVAGLGSLRFEMTIGQAENVYLIVMARYFDIFGKRHRSVAIWQLDQTGNGFTRIHVPEFNLYT